MPTDPLDLIETALHQTGSKLQRRGDTIQAQCPAHPDNNPSLSISRGTTQPVILTCHAGCDTNNILQALNLDWKDISQPTPTTPEQPVTYLYENADGTPTGYNQHRRQGEPACPACRQAHTEAVQQRKHRKP